MFIARLKAGQNVPLTTKQWSTPPEPARLFLPPGLRNGSCTILPTVDVAGPKLVFLRGIYGITYHVP